MQPASPLDDTSPIPLYHQLYLILRDQIAALPPDVHLRMATEDELRHTYGVSRVTVRKALEHLEADGVIARKPGRGTFVSQPQAQPGTLARDLRNLLTTEHAFWDAGKPPFTVELLEAERGPAAADVARALEQDRGADILRLRRRVLLGSEPLWLETRYLPLEAVRGIGPEEFETYSIMGLIASRTGRQISRIDLDVTAGTASASDARRLTIPANAPVLVTHYSSYADQTPMQTGRTTFRADKYRFRTSVSLPTEQHNGSAKVDLRIVPLERVPA
jgi:GntR family transcriptional regulator